MNPSLKDRILKAGLSVNGYSACVGKLDMIRSGYVPELFKRHIFADEQPEYHIDVWSRAGAGANAPALLGVEVGKILGAKEFVRLLDSLPDRRRRINPFAASLYAVGTGKSEKWACGLQQNKKPWKYTPPLCSEAEPYVQYCYDGESYADLKQTIIGILYDSVLMHLEDCEESELKRVLMSCPFPLIAVQSRIIRLPKPYPWRDVSMSSQCTGYIAGVAGKPGLAAWQKAGDFVIDNARDFLAIRDYYHPN